MLFHDAFYRFVPISDPESLVTNLETVCAAAGVQGSILVATEGINGVENADLSLPNLLALAGASSTTPSVQIRIVTTAVMTDI